MKTIIKERNDDKVSLAELSTNKIYGVSMNFKGNGGGQIDIMIIKIDSTDRDNQFYYFENMVVGTSYPTPYKNLQEIVSHCLEKPEIYKVYEFDNLLEFFEWGTSEINRLMELTGAPSSHFAYSH